MGTGQIRMSGGGTFTSDNSINYDWIARASPGNSSWAGIAYGNNLFATVSYGDGSNNSVATSPDGINWTLRTTPSPGTTWYRITYGNGTFVAVGDAGSPNRIMTSPDGITWTGRTSANNANNWINVAYGAGVFVAVAYGGGSNRIMYSSNNGATWQGVTTFDSFSWASVAYGNGRFVALPLFRSATFSIYSFDGINWTASTKQINALQWRGIAYGNGLFVAVSEGGDIAVQGTGGQQLTSHVMTSPDGITWTNRYAPDLTWSDIAYGNGLFIAVSNLNTGGKRTMTSPDGINWTLRPSANDNLGWRAIAYGNGIFVATSFTDGIGTKVMTLDPAYGMSINKITTEETTTNLVKFGQNGATISANPSKNFAWVARSATEANNWNSVCYGNGQFVSVAWTGTNRVMTSTDGYTWVAQTTVANNWLTVCYGELSGNNVYVAVANSGTNRSMYSTNGSSWTTYATPNDVSMGWLGVCFGYDTSGNGRFVATAGSGATGLGRIMTSPNGINWTQRNASDNTLSWRRICYGYDSSGQGQFVTIAFGGTNSSMYSIDGGVTWVGKATIDVSSAWEGICYGNGTFVAVATTGLPGQRVMYSRNVIGSGWTAANYPVENSWGNVAFGNGLFVAVANTGTGNRVMTSPDGINWTIRASVADNNWWGICYGNGTFVATSYSGTVMTNDYTANDNMLVLNGAINVTQTGVNSNGQLITNSTGQAAGWNSKFAIIPYLGTGGYNNLSSVGDVGLIWGQAGSGTNGNLVIAQHGGTGGVKITADGKVGIGTSSPAFPLDVSGVIRAQRQLHFGADNAFTIERSTDGSKSLYIQHYSNPNANVCFINNFVGGETRVGINTTTPAATLDVNGGINLISGGAYADRASNPFTSQFNICSTTNSNSRLKIGTHFTSAVAGSSSIQSTDFYNNAEHPQSLLLNPLGGYVGIGTTTPTSTLDVSGTTSTNKMLIRTADYTRTLTSTSYTANTWTNIIPVGTLTTYATYIINFQYSATAIPWGLYTSFLFTPVDTNSTSDYLSGAAVPTSTHDSGTSDFQIFVRSKAATGGNAAGVDIKITNTTAAGNVNIKAYRII
jgi:hypothetical protein